VKVTTKETYSSNTEKKNPNTSVL